MPSLGQSTMNLWVFWAAAGLSGLLRSCRKRAGPCTAVAPKVALPRQGRQPFRPLRGSLVNPCRRRRCGRLPSRDSPCRDSTCAVFTQEAAHAETAHVETAHIETAHVLSLLASALFLLHQIVAVAN